MSRMMANLSQKKMRMKMRTLTMMTVSDKQAQGLWWLGPLRQTCGGYAMWDIGPSKASPPPLKCRVLYEIFPMLCCRWSRTRNQAEIGRWWGWWLGWVSLDSCTFLLYKDCECLFSLLYRRRLLWETFIPAFSPEKVHFWHQKRSVEGMQSSAHHSAHDTVAVSCT